MTIPALGALVFAALLVQSKPNFSGTWTLVSSSEAGANPLPKVVSVVTQTDDTLTLKNGDLTLSWRLDGSETMITNPGPNGPVNVRIRARLEGGRMIVEQHGTIPIVQTVSLSADGNEMTIETVMQTPQGERRETQRFKKS
jgi:hypothetical protein